MQFKSVFPILIAHREVAAQSVAGVRLRQIQHELEQAGWKTIVVDNESDAGIVAGAHRGLAAILFDAEAVVKEKAALDRLVARLGSLHERAPGLPVIALGGHGGQGTVTPAFIEALRNIHSIVYLYEDTVQFLARQIMRAAEDYLENLLPPFFKALTTHAERSAYSWHTPGHAGGVGFLKSPVGYALHEFFGENTVRSDLSISVPELGSLLDHTGPVKAAEAYAARVFGADHTYFVTNGTSTANKIVWHSMAGLDDLVIVDRNCHKSLLHSLIMTGATPIYFTPARNDYGIIGPIGLDQFSPEAIKKKIAASPIARNAKGNVRIAVVTNSTYDGLCYNAEKIKAVVADQVDALHFDEAWYAYAAFHEFYAGRHAMGVPRGHPRADHTLVFATHSTHKLLAAFSQASMIHIQESQTRKIDTTRFNDAFMMHGSTSPHYGIIASLDVSSAMMEGASGRSIVQETHDEAMNFRRALAAVGSNFKRADWWFKVWQPDALDLGKAPKTEDWVLDPKASWHGFGKLADDYVMLDPIKVTLLTPGLGKGAKLGKTGIPASVVTKYLWERGLVVEKTGPVQLPDPVLAGHHARQVEFDGRCAGRFQDRLRRQRAAEPHAAEHRRRASLRRLGPARPVRRAARLLPRQRHRGGDERDVHRPAGTGDEALRCLRPPGARTRRAGADRPAEGPHHRGDDRALPARHPADHAGRALHDRFDHRVPEVRARHRRPLPRLRGRHPRPAFRRRPQGSQDLARRLREEG